jgi:DNA-binding CsgD family transcriptional regulator
MGRIDEADYVRVGRFVTETAELPPQNEPFSRAFLAALGRLVPCDNVSYSELDRVRSLELAYVEDPLQDGPEPELTYWDVRDEHHLCRHQEETLDFRAARLSDFVGLCELRRTRIYAEWLRPYDVERWLSVGLDAPLDHTKVFNFVRGRGADFTERDCAVLDAVRPFLAARYALWRAAQPLPVELDPAGALTVREREVLNLVAEGLTNGEIAQRLWIAPGTVRRHLEHVYDKLGVHTRTAAIRATAAVA